MVLTHFNLENILSSLALETETVNNNLAINSTSPQPLLLGAVKHLRFVTRYEIPVRESSLHILLIRTIVQKDGE